MIDEIIRFDPDGSLPRRSEYRPAPDVILLFLSDGSARILDLAGNFYSASQTAAFMLHETLELGLKNAAARVASTYHIENSRAQGDLETYIRELERQGLIVGPASRERPPGTESLPSQALRVLIDGVHALPLALQARIRILLGLGYAAIRFLGWPATIRAFQTCHRKISEGRGAASDGKVPEHLDRTLRAMAASYPVPIECKERALCCWALLRSMGLPAKLVVAISLFPLESHCWCQLEDRVLTDYLDRCERFTPVMTYD